MPKMPAAMRMSIAKRILWKRMLVSAAETATTPSAQYQSLLRGMCSCSYAFHRKTVRCGGIVVIVSRFLHLFPQIKRGLLIGGILGGCLSGIKETRT